MTESQAEPVEEPAAELVLPAPNSEVAIQPAPMRARDVAQDLQLASVAIRYLEVTNARADVSATLQMAVVCSGATPSDALEASAAFVRESPRVEVHSIAWARIPGPIAGTEEFQATLTVSYADRNGEYTGTTDHAPARG